jgi:hypothetical protein
MRLPRATPRPKLPALARALRVVLLTAAVVTLVLPTGCVRRRLNVRSNPPGALVFVDNQQIGTTPCSTDFTYYGTREIRLVKPGFETLTVNQPIPMPWYQIPPIDFVSENLVPNRITDHRTVSFDMQPQVIVPTEQLLDRANQLRQETQQTAATPPAVVLPPGGVPPGTVPPGAMPSPALAPGASIPSTTTSPFPTTQPFSTPQPGMVSPPGGFAPPPATSPQPTYPPAATPTPLPPVSSSQPPTTYAPTTPAPLGGTADPYAAPAPYGAPPAGPPPTTPYGFTPGPSTTAPFTAPTLPSTAAPIGTASPNGATTPQTIPPAGTQQGPPIVSPPLR